MKNYHTGKGPGVFYVVNNDEHPIIKSVTCKTYDNLKNITIDFKDKNNKMAELFQSIPGVFDIYGAKLLLNQTDMTKIIECFNIIQQVDPIPMSVINELMEHLKPFDLNKLTYTERVREKVEQNDHAEALRLALEAEGNDDAETLINLANLYQENNDYNNYLRVLEKIPPNHPSYEFAQGEILSDLLRQNVTLDNEKKIKLLEEKFKAALNAKKTPEADHFFNELCGGTSVTATLMFENLKGDADTLIKIAGGFRKMKEELEELRSYKTRTEAWLAAERRQTANKNNNNNNNNNNENDNSQKKSGINKFF